jgi:hypothetical protein
MAWESAAISLSAAEAKKDRVYVMNGNTYVCSGTFTGTVVCRKQ